MSKLIEVGKMHKGVTVKAEKNEVIDSDVVIAKINVGGADVDIVIPREELDIVPVGGPLFRYVGNTVEIEILSDADVESNIPVIGSLKKFKEDQRNKAIEMSEEIDAKIIILNEFGAYVEFNDVTALLKTQDFSTDFTKVSDVYKRGDMIKVRVKSANNNKKILVEAVEKYTESSKLSAKSIQEGSYLMGEVQTIKPCGVFVRVGKGLDVLTSMPAIPSLQVERGDSVVVQVRKVDVENNRLRGKIVKKAQ